jgi:hypothetical protein
MYVIVEFKLLKNVSLRCTLVGHNAVSSFHLQLFQLT